MKYAAIVAFKQDLSKYDETRPKHREYLMSLVAQGKLFVAGGFVDKTGGMIIYEAETPAQVDAMIQADPFMAAGIFDTWVIRPYNAFFVSPQLLPPTQVSVKYAAIIEYPNDPEKIAAIRPKHREYLGSLLAAGKLPVSGPFTDDSGALIVYQAESPAAAEALLKADPFAQAGVFVKYQIREWNVVLGNEAMYPKPSA
jgi:uncharacterized protein